MVYVNETYILTAGYVSRISNLERPYWGYIASYPLPYFIEREVFISITVYQNEEQINATSNVRVIEEDTTATAIFMIAKNYYTIEANTVAYPPNLWT